MRISSFTQPVSRFLDGLVHVSAIADELEAARHRSFIAAHLLGGLFLLSGFPLYLAWYGPTGWIETLILLFLIAPIAIALYLSHTGRFVAAHLASSACLTGLIALLAGLGGGATSFAAAWFIVVPVEATLSGSRRVVAAAIVLVLAAIASLAALSFFAVLPTADAAAPGVAALAIASTALAVLYVGFIALRIDGLQRVRERIDRVREARYRLLADNVSDVIAQHAPNGDVVYVSKAVKRVFGLGPADILGDGLFNRIHVIDRLQYLNAISTALHDRRVAAAEIRVRCDGGTEKDSGDDGHPRFKTVEIRCAPLSDTTEEGVVAVIRDISALKAHEAQLENARETAERANHSKTRFLANISHELRTPLNAIIGFSEVLLQELFGSLPHEKHREYIQLIHDSGDHLLNLVNGILDISKMEAGNFDVVPEPFEISKVIESCRQMMGQLAIDRDVTLVTELQSGLPELVADRRACKQIVLNLLSNAIKFTNPGGRVVVGARREGESVAIFVADNGIGIAEEDLPRLGTPFVQADSAYDRKYQGTGLGLSMVRGLAELHGGELEIDSKLGQGTTVTVRLPIAGPRASEAEETETATLVELPEPSVETPRAQQERKLNRAQGG